MALRQPDRGVLETIAAVKRLLRAAARRMVDEGDAFELAELLSVRDDVDSAIRDSVHAMRRRGASWQTIADATGTTRQAAFQRYGA